MKTEDLYAEVPCPRCGKNRLKSSSFCPHCGHVHEESFLDRLRCRLGGGPIQRPNPLALAFALLGLAVVAVLAAAAIAEGRYRDLIAIAIIAVLSIRAFLRLRKGTSPANEAGTAKTAESALEQALIARYGTLGRVSTPFFLRSHNGLVFTSRSYTALVRSYGLRQEFITPHTPEQNGMVERVIRTLKEQCAHRHRFETLQHASRVIGDWISFYNHRRPHQALGMKTPAATLH